MTKLTHSEILKQRKTIEEMRSSDKFPFVVMLNNIRSMHNIGSIFRTSDAAFIEKVYITGYTATPPREEINKTALGATETVDWEYFKEPLDCISLLKENGYRIVALEQSSKSIDLYEYDLPSEKICLVLGNEVFGVDQEILDLCDDDIDIPMNGMKHSLNVSVAYGIAIFELVHKYKLQI